MATTTESAISYTATRERIAGLLHEIDARIERRYADFDNLNWGDVGSAIAVAELLEEAAAHLR